MYDIENGIINFLLDHLFVKDTCFNCQTVTLTADPIQNHMLLEKNVGSPKNESSNIFKNSQLYLKILLELPILNTSKLHPDNRNV